MLSQRLENTLSDDYLSQLQSSIDFCINHVGGVNRQVNNYHFLLVLEPLGTGTLTTTAMHIVPRI